MSGRLARGRSYAEAGQVLDLALFQGKVTARLQGSRAQREAMNLSRTADRRPCHCDRWLANACRKRPPPAPKAQPTNGPISSTARYPAANALLPAT